jgi:hypothetical protein
VLWLGFIYAGSPGKQVQEFAQEQSNLTHENWSCYQQLNGIYNFVTQSISDEYQMNFRKELSPLGDCSKEAEQ